MFFVGTFDLSIDTKNRLSVPYAIRAKLNPEEDGRSFYVLPGRRKGTLAIYPDRYFERQQADPPPADDLSDGTYEWRQFECAQTALVDPDGQGRILVPDRLLKRAGIGKEAMLLGVHDHMELWSRPDFEAFQDRKWPDYPQHRAKAVKELKELASESAAESEP